MRYATKASVFSVLRNLEIKTVIDIGVERCTASLIESFPDAHHILVESDPKWVGGYSDTYHEISIEVHNYAASSSRRVDSIDCKGPVLLKVDVDGPEMDVLIGCSGLFPIVAAIVVEATTDKLSSLAVYLQENGYNLFDVVDMCYCGPQLHQVDLVFVRKPEECKVRVAWDVRLYQDSSLLNPNR